MNNTELQYTSIDRITALFGMKFKSLEVPKNNIIEFTGEALNYIGLKAWHEERVAFLTVQNHTAKIPKGMKYIVQVAYKNSIQNYHYNKPCQNGRAYMSISGMSNTQALDSYSNEIYNKECQELKDLLCPATIIESMQENMTVEEKKTCYNKYANSKTCCHPILDCNGKIISDYEVAYYRPYFDLLYRYHLWGNSSYYKQHFTPVRLAQSTFFNTLVCKENNYNELYSPGCPEYSIRYPYLNFSFEKGIVAISYLHPLTDERGYPMIPDVQEYIDCIVNYIAFQKVRDDFINQKSTKVILDKLEYDYEWSLAVAHSRRKNLRGLDAHNQFTQQQQYIMPRRTYFNNFFGSFSDKESRKWLNPTSNNYATAISPSYGSTPPIL